MTDPLLTVAARRYVRRMLAAIVPFAGKLDRRFRVLLRDRGYGALQLRALLAITPSAASRLSSLNSFLEQVEYNGRRLAKLNVQPDEVKTALKAFGALLDAALQGQFEPPREQLFLATVLALQEAFYEVRNSEAQALFDLSRAEADATHPDDLLRRFVQILTRTFHASAGRLLLGVPGGGTPPRPLYIERGDPLEDRIADPEMRGRFESYWSFPMGPSGLLQFGFARPYPWLPRELTLLQAVAGRCSEALEKARLQAENRRLDAEARKAEEEERRRIGRELHDEAVQSLAVLRLQLELLERDAGPAISSQLAEARGTTERIVHELRRMVAALSPATLERLGLGAALRQLVARFGNSQPATAKLRISGDCSALPMQSQEVIYRVAQESLENIRKHSQATRVNLLLQSTDKKIRLSVSDNGAGFREEILRNKPMSFGLAGMRERSELLHGALTVRSTPGKGVRVVLELPPTCEALKANV